MTKGGNGKPKTLGRLIFGEKRKQPTSPSRPRPSTRNGGSMADLSTSAGVTTTNKNSINIHDWAVWRIQLNEQLGSGMTDRRSELKQMRQFLQASPFYQQHCQVTSNGRYSGVRLLFSIPRAKFKPELLDSSRGEITKTNNNEIEGDTKPYEQKTIRSNSDERTTSATSVSTVQPAIVVDKTISQLFPKGLIANTGDFLQVNEQMVAADIMRTRRTGRNSFRASDRIHSTLQKAVKDGNVLEKIKAFEMQAAAAQAESAIKLGGLNHRMQTVTSSVQSAAHRTLSPVFVHPIQQPISPTPVQPQQQQQTIRSNRGHHVHPVQHLRDASHGPIIGHESRKGAHVLEPAHGDIILKRRTPSQKTVNDEDYSITAISSVAATISQGHHQRGRQPQHHHRTSLSRSRHRQEMTYDKRAPSNHENPTHKHQQKPKRTITPSSKSSTRRRWLKGRKDPPTVTPVQSDKQEIPNVKSNKSSKNKKKTIEQEKTNRKKGKSSSDNNRVYGVSNTDVSEQTKIESPPPPVAPKIDEKVGSDPERDNTNTNTYMAPKEVELSHNKEVETVIVTTIQRRSSKKHHQQKLSSTDGEILSKVDENIGLDDHNRHFEDDGSEGDVFLEDSPVKLISHVTRHQSIVNLPNHESHRLQQQQQQSSSKVIQRHASHCSAEELTPNNHRYQRLNENFLKKKSTPITLITRKNKINRDEQNVYETPHSEQIQCNSHILKKTRPFHTITTAGNSIANGQTNNKQISKQILHAIMNSMNNNQEQLTANPTRAFSVNDEFFENGPLTNPEEILPIITPST